jgi:hypothetical protein
VVSGKDDRELAAALINALATRAQTIDRVFFDWRGGEDPGADLYPGDAFRRLAKLLDGRSLPKTHSYWSENEPCSMHIEEVEEIWSAIADHDDWQPFNNKVKAIRLMGDAIAQDAPAS